MTSHKHHVTLAGVWLVTITVAGEMTLMTPVASHFAFSDILDT